MTDDPIRINDHLEIPAADLSYEYARSGGPGGQHANTADTAVRLRFDLQGTRAIAAGVKARLRQARPGAITADGELLVTSERHRSRTMNIEDARNKLAELVREHLKPPKRRRPTRPTRASKKRRLEGKKKRGDVKSKRGRIKDW